MKTLLHMLHLAIITLYQQTPLYRLRARILLLRCQVEAERLRSERLALQLWQAEIKLADDRWYKFDNEQLRARLKHYDNVVAGAMMRREMVTAKDDLSMEIVDIP